MTRSLPSFAALALALAAYAHPAHAQMGTSNNPPPQHLFTTGQTAAPGGSTMAERRAKLATAKRTHRTVHR